MIKRHFKLEFQRAGKLPVLKGTTTIGVVCHDGVVLTTDTRATMGSFVAHKHAKKVYRSEEHTSELQSQSNLVCRLLLEKKKQQPALSGKTDTDLTQDRPEICFPHARQGVAWIENEARLSLEQLEQHELEPAVLSRAHVA